MNKIDWEFWENKKEIALWEAVLLSLSFGPESKIYQGKGLNQALRKKEIAERLKLLKDTLKRKRDFNQDKSSPDFKNSDCVDIGQFAAWCICTELSIPDPLRDMSVPIETQEEILLTNNLDNLHRLTEAFFGRSGNASPDVIEEIDLRAKERRKTNRYTLEEAAFYVGLKAAARAKNILTKFIDAVHNGSLIVYEPEGDEKYKPDLVRGWYEEANNTDLNDWLENNEPSIGRVFHEVAPRSNRIMEFLKELIEGKKVPLDSESVWKHIRENMGEPGCLFQSGNMKADNDDDSFVRTTYGEKISKKNLIRRFNNLLKKNKTTHHTIIYR